MDGNVTGKKEKEIIGFCEKQTARKLHNRINALEKLEELIKIKNKFKDWKA